MSENKPETVTFELPFAGWTVDTLSGPKRYPQKTRTTSDPVEIAMLREKPAVREVREAKPAAPVHPPEAEKPHAPKRGGRKVKAAEPEVPSDPAPTDPAPTGEATPPTE